MPLGERFLFDLSFDEADLSGSEEEIEVTGLKEETGFIDMEADIPSFSQEQVDEAHKHGHDAGFQAGLEKAKAETETSIQETLEKIHILLNTLFKNQAIDSTNTFDDAVKIALAITRKCFPHQNIIHGFKEIDFIVREVLKEILDEPRVFIHINPEIKAVMANQVKTITREIGFPGQVLILEDEKIMLGDCKVNWSTGGAVRNIEDTFDKIDQIIESNFANLYKGLPVESENNLNAPDHLPLSEEVDPTDGATSETIQNIVGYHLPEKNPATDDASSTISPSINDTNKAVHSPSNIAEENAISGRKIDSVIEAQTNAPIDTVQGEEGLGSSSTGKDSPTLDTPFSQEKSTTDILNDEIKMGTPNVDEGTDTSLNNDTTTKTEPIE